MSILHGRIAVIQIFCGISENIRIPQVRHSVFECRMCRGVHGFEVVRNWFDYGCKICNAFRERSVVGYMGMITRSWNI